MQHKALHLTPRGVPYCPLAIANAFRELTPKQRLYAHYMMSAGWSGLPVVAMQLSPESLPLLRLFYKVLSAQPLAEFKANAEQHGVSADEVAQFLEFFALTYANGGNYLSFGDSKFIPACSREVFAKIVESTHGQVDPALLEAVYSLEPAALTLDFPPTGQTAYYSTNISRADATVANAFLAAKKMEAVNTRVTKDADGGLVIHVASAAAREVAAEAFEGRRIALRYGDFAREMQRVVDCLTKARAYVANDVQKRMLDDYITHFTTGDVEAHKASQREWVKDLAPAVESNIGFIESYRDPSGVRAEWEGFVAVVNRDQSKKYADLVANAEPFIAQLPWGRGFEKDTFRSPDFTSLDVLGFASSGIPSGICIPNYDDIRQEDGFKNVYLANVVSSINLNDKLNHLSDADWEAYKAGFVAAMSVNVGIHELLGHGTGKLLMQRDDGSLNFEKGLVNPITQQPVASWYKPGDTFGSVFGGIGSSYEECRAEAVALYLCVVPELLSIFDLKTEAEQDNAVYVCWLNMVRAGLLGLEFYTPETQQWRQAHMRARFCILQALVRAEDPIVQVVKDEKDGLRIELDGARIKTSGVKAIGDLLVHLNVFKATADASRGSAYYSDLTSVSEEYVAYRNIIMEKRKPRRQFVQAHTTLTGEDDVELREFEGSVEGMVASFIARHKDIPL